MDNLDWKIVLSNFHHFDPSFFLEMLARKLLGQAERFIKVIVVTVNILALLMYFSL